MSVARLYADALLHRPKADWDYENYTPTWKYGVTQQTHKAHQHNTDSIYTQHTSEQPHTSHATQAAQQTHTHTHDTPTAAAATSVHR